MDDRDFERYQVTLYRGDQLVMRGWWASRTVAESKFKTLIGRHRDAHVVLTDELEGEVLAV
ncbi:hypothetical protein [Streptomyces cavernae]|uniref:hypothetical protein n=1 Tax=Streptomyces cavernae TaxID=2259034 RepID=UPI000FEBDD68|nr:hypothetical protein [Streptomyces cavernae]